MIRYPMSLPFFPEGETEKILSDFRMMLSGKDVLSMGKWVKEFELQFALYSGVYFGVATNSCSAALEIALRTIDLKPYDEVIVPVETFIATGSSVVREGGRPVFAGINPDTFCLSVEEVERRITSKTKAVILVHMAGLITPEVLQIKELCSAHRLYLIEDAAHAPGALFANKKSGSFGDLACFSFYPTKVITSAEGGMLLTNNERFYQQANAYRNRGLDMNVASELYSHLGTNNRMSEFAARMGLSQLSCLDEFINKRNRIAKIYSESLCDFVDKEWCNPLIVPSNGVSSYWRYIVRIHSSLCRERLRATMNQKGIALDWAYDPPLHLQPVFKKLYGNQDGMLQNTEELMRHFVCLPIYPQLSDQDAQFIINTFKEIVEQNIGK